MNGNGSSQNRKNTHLIWFLGLSLLLVILGESVLVERLLTHPPHKSSWDAIMEFIKQSGQIKTILISGLLGALTQKAIDTATTPPPPLPGTVTISAPPITVTPTPPVTVASMVTEPPAAP